MTETVNQEIATKEVEPKTFTQEEVNGIVNDRLARERKKYEGIDLDVLKSKAAKFDEMEEANKTELEKANERANELQARLEGVLKEKELTEMREKVAKEIGVPSNLLTAESEDDCRSQAEAIKAYAQPSGYPKVRDGGEVNVVSKTTTRQQFADWANAAFN